MPQRLFNMLNTLANKYLLRTSLPSILSLSMFGLSLGISSTTFAASISYQQAEQSVLQDSYSTQATQALQHEPYRVCRRLNILRDYSDDKIKIYP